MTLLSQFQLFRFKTSENISVIELNQFLDDLFAAYEGALFIENLIHNRDQFGENENYYLAQAASNNSYRFTNFIRSKKRERSNEILSGDSINSSQLKIGSININSPGEFTFFGLPDPIKSITDFVHEINDHRKSNKQFKQNQIEAEHRMKIERKKDKREEQEHLQKMELNKLEILSRKIQILKDTNHTAEEIQKYTNTLLLNPTKRLVERNPKFTLDNENLPTKGKS